jgi:hypothetical protein
MVVKDFDRSVGALSKLFDVEFKEIPEAEERMGMRIWVSVPDFQLELMSVVDPSIARSSDIGREIAEFAKKFGEGIFKIFLKVDDAEEALADAEKKKIGVHRLIERKSIGGFFPHFKAVTFTPESGMPAFAFGLIEYVGREK